MKQIFKQIILSAAALAVVGCSLDRLPETTLTDSNFWQSETDLRGACNRLYQQMGGQLGGFYHDYRSDELVGNSANSISDGSRTVPSTSSDWTDPYWRINISNNILKKAPNAKVTEDVLNKYLAEAYFFRAYHYFELVKRYGDVPLITEEYPDFEKYLPWGPFYGVFVKEGTDAAVIETLAKAFSEAGPAESYQEVLGNFNINFLGYTGEDAKNYIASWRENTVNALKNSGALEQQ